MNGTAIHVDDEFASAPDQPFTITAEIEGDAATVLVP